MYFLNFAIIIYFLFFPEIGQNCIDNELNTNEKNNSFILMIENGPQTICIGDSVEFKASLLTANGEEKLFHDLQWITSDENIGEIDNNGKFISKNPGETSVKVMYKTEDSIFFDDVPVKVRCNNIIGVNPSAIMDCKGEVKDLEIESNNIFSFIFKSSNSQIAEVDSNGQVLLKQKGECSIYILSETGKCFKEIPVIVI